jgi:hypothetical protein
MHAQGCADRDTGSQADCRPGDEASCGCAVEARSEREQNEAPIQGTMLCHGEGAWGPCSCKPRQTLPCSTPGVASACRCADGALGQAVCKNDGALTDCACQEQGPEPGEQAEDAGSSASTACPANLFCTLQRGRNVCTNSAGVPPLCKSARDCATAGLLSAECMDPDIGVKVCVQLCKD